MASNTVKHLSKKACLLLACIFFSNVHDGLTQTLQKPTANEKKTNLVLEKIRGDQTLLRAFFSRMPKGGDLHHHFSGALYAEEMYLTALKENLFVNTFTGQLFDAGHQPENMEGVMRMQAYEQKNGPAAKRILIDRWSIRNFVDSNERSSHEHFFGSFGLFGASVDNSSLFYLKKLRKRALAENVQYIETMLNPKEPIQKAQMLVNKEDEKLAYSALDFENFYLKIKQAKDVKGEGLAEYTKAALDSINYWHLESQSEGVSEKQVRIRYLAYVNRTKLPAKVFEQLIFVYELAQLSVQQNGLVRGINIVAPEDFPNSMEYYNLHMEMFKFLNQKYPLVKIAIHAGELTLGLVEPENLTFHISEAVKTAGGKRVGHGIDIAYEKDAVALLKEMANKGIAIEIPLSSNEYILKISGDRHPIMTYFKYKVPITLATDDAGIFRTDLSEQFLLAAYRYPTLRYSDLKKMAINSIEYSFMSDTDKKEAMTDLIQKLNEFESWSLTAF